MNIQELERHIEEGNFLAINEILAKNPALARIETSQHISAVMLACYYKKMDIANLIAEFSSPITLFEACALGKFERVFTLITEVTESINSFSDDGFTPLGLACFFGHEEIAAFLVKHHAEVNLPSDNGFHVFPIHSAVAARNLSITQILLNAGALANVKQQSGLTPLHSAAQNGDIEIIVLLLEAGADINARMDDGRLPADLAAEKGFNEIAAILKD